MFLLCLLLHGCELVRKLEQLDLARSKFYRARLRPRLLLLEQVDETSSLWVRRKVR